MYWTTKRIALLAFCATALIVNFHTANAATFEIIGGSPLSTGPAPLYGNSLPQNNVVNSPYAPPTGAPVFDPSGPNLTGDTPWVQGGQVFAHTCCSPAPPGTLVGGLSHINWFFLGSESSFDITFHSPGLTDFTEGNQNNSAYGGGPPLPFGAQFLGQKFVTSGPISFSLTWETGSIDSATSSTGPGVPNLIFSYAFFEPNPDRLVLTKSISDIVVFALNDGGTDHSHDAFVGAALIVEAACDGGCIAPPAETPIPAALPLFGSVLAGGLLLHRWRKRRSAMARA